jgi:hypothetical protein
MGQFKLVPPTNVLSHRVARVVKGVANCHGEPKSYLPGAIEPPLPLTPQRLEAIKAYLNVPLRSDEKRAATRIPESVAPRPQAAQPAGDYRLAFAPLTAPLLALSSGIRALAATLILVALLPNLTLGALLWLRVINPPSSGSVALSPSEGAVPGAESTILSPVITAPTALQATAGEHITFRIAVDGTDGVPAGSLITVSGLPRGSTLSAGRPHGETEWNLEPGEIGDLHLALPKTAGGEAKLTTQLLAPDGNVLADSATMLKVTSGPEDNIPIHRVKTQPIQGQVWDEPEPNAMDLEARPANPDAATSTLELVPLPTRRPARRTSTPSGNVDANWIKPSAFVNLRKGPTASAAVVGVVAKGVKLRVKGRKRGWVEVTNPTTSQEGWVYGGHVETVR